MSIATHSRKFIEGNIDYFYEEIKDLTPLNKKEMTVVPYKNKVEVVSNFIKNNKTDFKK